MHKVTRCVVCVVAASCLLFFALVPRYGVVQESKNGLLRRQILSSISVAPSSSATPTDDPASTSSAVLTSSAAPSTTAAPSTSTQQQTTTPQNTTPATTANNNPQTSNVNNNNPTSAAAPSSSSSSSSQVSITSNSAGQVETITPTTTSNLSASSSAATSDASSPSSSGLSTGSIVGMSVAGGVAVIGIIAFFVWKFTRKRFADFEDNEAIKWPELNSHGGEAHALPTHATGRAGFGDDSDGLTRAPSDSHGGYASSLATTSTPEFYASGGPDPYAVPPLPHLNPNQPYHDDPGYGGNDTSSFYDPYRGPVPNTFNEADSVNTTMEGHPLPQQSGYGGEAIPMTQMARTRSPGPQVGLGYDMARASPQPTMGRQSPGPQAALGYGGQMMEDRSRSPGPAMGLGGPPARLPSPGPHAAYGGDGYGGR